MPKTATRYVCNECGATHPAWSGRCSQCGAWNALEEVHQATGSHSAAATPLPTQAITDVATTDIDRLSTGSTEFDRVLGGGIVAGSIMLLGGEPGIGKSTLLTQLAGRLSQDGPVLYVSGEESAEQIALRARRLGIAADQLQLLTAIDVDRIIQTMLVAKPRLAIIDSIQTVQTNQVSSAAGSVTQVRETAARLQTVAKAHSIPVMVVGHVTKEGSIAGPKVLEHLVDVVLYLEGEKYHGYRLLRGAKNRFGATDEVGVFTMSEEGLSDESDPAGAFVDKSALGAPGTVVTASLEGTRVLLAEVQALGVETSFGYPKRTASGVDANKLALLLAVLTKHAGIPLGSTDVYCNVSGGYRLHEPAADLSVALAVVSAVRSKPLPSDTIIFGEVGLSGEIRSVQALSKRLEEAKRAGFTRAIIPSRGPSVPQAGLTNVPVATIGEAISKTFATQEAHAR